jgi:hypothetical protein
MQKVDNLYYVKYARYLSFTAMELEQLCQLGCLALCALWPSRLPKNPRFIFEQDFRKQHTFATLSTGAASSSAKN